MIAGECAGLCAAAAAAPTARTSAAATAAMAGPIRRALLVVCIFVDLRSVRGEARLA
jgi:hypothetical protein